MSNNVCPYCRGVSSTGGFVHETNCPMMQGGQAIPGGVPIKAAGDNVCPICGDAYFRCDHYPNVLISEIYRLKSALAHMQVGLSVAMAERDEARQWARQMYRNWRLSEAWREVENG